MSWRNLQWFPEVGRLYGVNGDTPVGVWFSKREAEIADVLYKRRGRPVHILSLIGALGLTRGNICAHICNIRNKLAANGSPWAIHTDYCDGYELRECVNPHDIRRLREMVAQLNQSTSERFA